MPARDCWYCGVMSHMTNHGNWAYVHLESSSKLTQTWCLFRCDNCSAVSLATSQVPTSDFREMTTSDSSNFWTEQERNAKWYPKPPIVGKDFPGVPQHIAEAASEAYKCRSISAFRASVLLARSVIEATAKDKRIAHGNLSAKIDELFDQRFIRKHIRDEVLTAGPLSWQ